VRVEALMRNLALDDRDGQRVELSTLLCLGELVAGDGILCKPLKTSISDCIIAIPYPTITPPVRTTASTVSGRIYCRFKKLGDAFTRVPLR
jgi:hypothetical protein